MIESKEGVQSKLTAGIFRVYSKQSNQTHNTDDHNTEKYIISFQLPQKPDGGRI